MQFRKQAKKIQVFAYRGYDREKRRAKVEFLGSLDAYSFKPSDGLMDKLTDAEKIEVQEYEKNARLLGKKEGRLSTLKTLSYMMENASEGMEDEDIASQVTSDDASRMMQAWDRLAKALRKRGHRRTTAEAQA